PRIHQHLHIPLLFILPLTTTAISLSSFQPISSTNPSCLKAYNAQIPTCVASDFTNGAPCTQKCITSLLKVQNIVEDACKGIAGPKDSLLGTVLTGKMVVTLCPNYKPDGGDTKETKTAKPVPAKSTKSPEKSGVKTITRQRTSTKSKLLTSTTTLPKSKSKSKPSSSDSILTLTSTISTSTSTSTSHSRSSSSSSSASASSTMTTAPAPAATTSDIVTASSLDLSPPRSTSATSPATNNNAGDAQANDGTPFDVASSGDGGSSAAAERVVPLRAMGVL
ncbi:MAG: hypothetical protein M4579_007565, partial [Chaenotheca gracillima]